MRLFARALPVSIAVAALVSLAAAGCGTSPGSVPPKSATAAHAGFAGYKWQVVAIDHGGKHTPIPARYSVFLQFAPNGQFGANDPVNYHSGAYRQTGDGFTLSDVATSLAGYAGNDPVVLLAVNAIGSFDQAARATATVTGNRLVVTVNGYALVCQRDGTQANFPPAGPT